MRYIALIVVVLALAACGNSPPQHSAQWQSGYRAGEQMYQNVDFNIGAGSGAPPKNSADTQLVNYCDQNAIDVEPNLSNYTQWLDGYSYGCYGGS